MVTQLKNVDKVAEVLGEPVENYVDNVFYPRGLDFDSEGHVIEYQRLFTLKPSEQWTELDLAMLFDASRFIFLHREQMQIAVDEGMMLTSTRGVTNNPHLKIASELLNMHLKVFAKLVSMAGGARQYTSVAMGKETLEAREKEVASQTPKGSLLAQPSKVPAE